jgi:hypothetical protein
MPAGFEYELHGRIDDSYTNGKMRAIGYWNAN